MTGGDDGGDAAGDANLRADGSGSGDAADAGDASATDGNTDACAADAASCADPACPGGRRSCPVSNGAMACVDVQSDDQNCGACGHVCNIPGTCATGDCARRVFVTSTSYLIGGSSTLRNLSDADGFCQTIAAAHGLKNVFRAWMSDSSQYPANGLRFTQSTQPYRLMDVPRTTIANSFADLTSGMLRAPIDVDETGATVAAGDFVWTGTRVDGQRAPTGNCTSWSSNAQGSSANAGQVTSTSNTWTENSLPCDGMGHLYCFEQ